MARTAHIQKARARARLMRPAGEAAFHAANHDSCEPIDNAQLVKAAFALESVEDLEPPFDPPDESDFDVIDEEDAVFVRADDITLDDLQADETFAALANVESEPIVEPLLRLNTIEAAVEAEPAVETVDEEPPFDAPDERDECFQPPLVENNLAPLRDEAPRTELLLTTNERAKQAATPAASFPRDPRTEEEPPVRPAPAIAVLACWDRAETGELIARAASDERLARAEFYGEIGGIDAAIDLADQCLPDLVIVESALPRDHLLAGIDSLLARVGAHVKIIVLGAVNDITLLRDLALRGVSQYIVQPIADEDLVRGICALYAETDNARVVAVIGARGGVGASTLAYNIAWSMAERQHMRAAVLDLDVAFGTMATHATNATMLSAADILARPDALKPASADGRLRLLTAEPTLDTLFEPDASAAADLVARVRRESPFVVLDVPHAWAAWVKQILIAADEVVIVAGPDLASLRNAEQMLRILRNARGDANAPLVVLSMTGVPKRPEIALKDLTETLGTNPIVTFPFEPEAFGVAEIAHQSIGQSAPRSEAALAIDRLATILTGREVNAGKQRAPKIAKRTTGPSVQTPHEAGETARRKRETVPKVADIGPAIAIEPFKSPVLSSMAEPSAPPPFTFRAAAIPFEPPHPIPAEGEAELIKFCDTAVRNVADAQAKRVRRGRPGMLRAAACVFVLILISVWHIQNQRAASAAAPQRATPSVSSAALAPSAQTHGSPAAQYDAALQLLSAGDLERGVMRLQSIAESGFAPAQYQLAKLYERGQGVETDITLARHWTERAAASGDRRAMHDLGVYYARGEGAPTDAAAAFRWFRQAAEHGVIDSQYNLAVLYEEGRGVSRNEQEALFWFLAAGRAGDLAAIQRANALEPRLSPMQVDQAHARALAFRTIP